jgi:hypothetical protein
MDSNDITDMTTGLVGTLAVTGIAFAGLRAFSDMTQSYSQTTKGKKRKAKRQEDLLDYDFGKGFW